MAINPVAPGEFSTNGMSFIDAVLATPSIVMIMVGLTVMVTTSLGQHRSVGGFFCGLGATLIGMVLGATGTGWVAVGLIAAYFKWAKK